MSEHIEYLSIKKCPACGKEFSVLYPHLWAYRMSQDHGGKFYCSWKCLRTSEKQHEERIMKRVRLTQEDRREAVETAMGGGDPVKWLEEKGYMNPRQMWTTIRKRLKEEDPGTYERLPESQKTIGMGTGCQIKERKAQPSAGGEGADAEKTDGTAAADRETDVGALLAASGFEIAAIRREDAGEFYLDRRTGSIRWRRPGNEAGGWEIGIGVLKTVMRILGVTGE